MIKRIIVILAIISGATGAGAATRMATSTARGANNSTAAAVRSVNGATNAGTASGFNYNYMYPYLNNQMRTALNPGVTPSQAGNPISVITRTAQLSSPRRVVPRKTTTARSAAAAPASMGARGGTPSNGTTSVARSAMPTSSANATAARSAVGAGRRVVARGGTSGSGARAAATNPRGDNSTAGAVYSQSTPIVTTSRCLADYTKCMNDYCVRENTEYNRCYCSARLAQIDATYRPEIDRLIKQLLTLKSENRWTNAEMNEYWMDTIGKFTGTNSWENLDNALNIDWTDMESRVRGQNAFNVGHDYCVQHLRNCAPSAGNLRDAYRSEITRDCDAYENSLMRIKNVAESIIGNYSE